MIEQSNHSDPIDQWRKPIILIGAPSGAGKTVLSQKIIAGEFPSLVRLCSSAPEEALIRYDLKLLPYDPPPDRILIIECSTYNFEKLTSTEQWRRMATLISESEMIIHINFIVPKRTIVRQYFRRIFTGPKRINLFYRILQISKYRTALVYMSTRELSRSDEAWFRFGKTLAKKMPNRVAIVRVQRTGAEYIITFASHVHS